MYPSGSFGMKPEGYNGEAVDIRELGGKRHPWSQSSGIVMVHLYPLQPEVPGTFKSRQSDWAVRKTSTCYSCVDGVSWAFEGGSED